MHLSNGLGYVGLCMAQTKPNSGTKAKGPGRSFVKSKAETFRVCAGFAVRVFCPGFLSPDYQISPTHVISRHWSLVLMT